MSIETSKHSIPNVIMIDGEHLATDYDVGKRTEDLTAFLKFSIKDRQMYAKLGLGGDTEETWIQAGDNEGFPALNDEHETELLHALAMVDADWPGEITCLWAAYFDPGDVDPIDYVLASFHDRLAAIYEFTTRLSWQDGNAEMAGGLVVEIILKRFGVDKRKLTFHIPYDEAVKVVVDRRRKAA